MDKDTPSNTTGREYRYQWDWQLPNNQMAHVRCDDWTEFVGAKRNMESQIEQIVVATPPPPPLSHPGQSPLPLDTPICADCQSPLSEEKRITSKKNGKQYWVRNCPAKPYEHKGTIRPAS